MSLFRPFFKKSILTFSSYSDSGAWVLNSANQVGMSFVF